MCGPGKTTAGGSGEATTGSRKAAAFGGCKATVGGSGAGAVLWLEEVGLGTSGSKERFAGGFATKKRQGLLRSLGRRSLACVCWPPFARMNRQRLLLLRLLGAEGVATSRGGLLSRVQGVVTVRHMVEMLAPRILL